MYGICNKTGYYVPLGPLGCMGFTKKIKGQIWKQSVCNPAILRGIEFVNFPSGFMSFFY